MARALPCADWATRAHVGCPIRSISCVGRGCGGVAIRALGVGVGCDIRDILGGEKGRPFLNAGAGGRGKIGVRGREVSSTDRVTRYGGAWPT